MYRSLLTGLLVCSAALLAAEPKKPAPKNPPKVKMAAPLGIAAGVKTRLILRGQNLDSATEVRCQEPRATVKLLKASKSGQPNRPGRNRRAETQLEVEVTLPPDYPNRTVIVTVLTPDGESPPHALLIDHAPVLDEKEPNNSFRQAQAIAPPQDVQGRIDAAKDVDLYRFEGKAGQHVTIEVHAARYGSPLDPLLTLYDAEGRILASCDDAVGSADSRLEMTLPKDGGYTVGIMDANDEGGPAYLYRLSLRFKNHP